MDAEPLLSVHSLDVTFEATGRGRSPVRAVIGADLAIHDGETLGLVGESGSGKSTIGRAILGLTPVAGGTIHVRGLGAVAHTSMPLRMRRAVQAVFQDPIGSLDPTKTVAATVGEPIGVHRRVGGVERRRLVQQLLDRVGLAAVHADRYPYELSGGQRQRVAIARALAVEPQLIVLDEAVSALDVSVQAQIVQLLEELQRESDVAYLFIAHDLAVVRHISHRIAVIYRGRIVEVGTADQVCDRPLHPYTKMLLAAVPEPDPSTRQARRQQRRTMTTDGAVAVTENGCPFADRCPLASDVCAESFPEWLDLGDDGLVACHAVAAARGKEPNR